MVVQTTNTSRADSTTASSANSSVASAAKPLRQDSVPGGDLQKKTILDESVDSIRVLAWGNKKKWKIPLSQFTAVHKGKTTDRTKKNSYPSSRLLSLMSTDPHLGSLDIEAPTRLDRDKFALAFSKFLRVPLVEEPNSNSSTNQPNPSPSSVASAPIPHGTCLDE
jgi:hypothetical protein